MSRVLSGIQPTGDLHLGNYLGALRNWVAFQEDHEALYCLVDLHALTIDIEPDVLRTGSLEAATRSWRPVSTPNGARSSSRATCRSTRA